MKVMGLTRLTRYELFMNVVEFLEQQESNRIYMFENYNEIKKFAEKRIKK